MKRKTKNTLKTIALAVLGVGAIVGGASLINNMVGNDEDLKTIHPIFEVGGLDETTGKYVEDDGTIYTKEAFECQGLEIKLDFDNTIDYQVFYYISDGTYLSSTNVLSGNRDLTIPSFATHARIEITPNWDEMGEDYKKDKDQVIKWYEVSKYSSQMEIKVDKDQDQEMSMALFDMSEVDISTLSNADYETGPYMYADNTLIEGEKVTRLGFPVKSITDCTKDSIITVYKVSGGPSNAVELEKYEFVIEANTYSSNAVNEWVYFDCDIELDNDESLAFVSTKDSAKLGYYSATNEQFGDMYISVLGEATKISGSLVVDIWVAED